MISRNSVFNFTSDALSDMENESKFQISERIVILHDMTRLRALLFVVPVSNSY